MTVSWKNEIPFSEEFQDIYYSKENGAAETEHVFIEGNALHERWPSNNFVIGETGFGTGLNFICALNLWIKKNNNGRLHFISIEKFPLERQVLTKVYKSFPALYECASLLLKYYPEKPLYDDIYNIEIPEANCSLTIICKDVCNSFDKFETKVDAWFLDGFSPSKNKAMWTEEVFKEIRKTCYNSSTLSTFTSAGFVRRGLEEAGFKAVKSKGFGSKKHMIKAYINAR